MIILRVIKRIIYAIAGFIGWAYSDMTRKEDHIARQSRRTRFEVFRLRGGFFHRWF